VVKTFSGSEIDPTMYALATVNSRFGQRAHDRMPALWTGSIPPPRSDLECGYTECDPRNEHADLTEEMFRRPHDQETVRKKHEYESNEQFLATPDLLTTTLKIVGFITHFFKSNEKLSQRRGLFCRLAPATAWAMRYYSHHMSTFQEHPLRPPGLFHTPSKS
jgi:hypothetical protein